VEIYYANGLDIYGSVLYTWNTLGVEFKMKIQCPKCNYEWDTNSEMIYVTCPSCQRKSEIKSRRKETEGDAASFVEIQ